METFFFFESFDEKGMERKQVVLAEVGGKVMSSE